MRVRARGGRGSRGGLRVQGDDVHGVTEKHCYCLSKRPNCFRGTCSGLGTWRPRCTEDASSGTRHVVPFPPLSLIGHVTALRNGGANPMMPALSMTHASAPAPVPF